MTTYSVRLKRVGFVDVPLPTRQTSGSAGYDLCAALPEPLLLAPGERALVPTGWAMELPAGCEAQIRPRSGLALRHGVTVLNSPGTIDSDYRGEVRVLLVNHGDQAYELKSGERVAQMVFSRVSDAVFQVSDDLGATERGGGGYGSTGI